LKGTQVKNNPSQPLDAETSRASQTVTDAGGRLLGWCSATIELSNAPHLRPRRGKSPRLSNAQVWERIARFTETGDPDHLPPRLKSEASGILNVLLEAAARGRPPWPGPGPEPGPETSLAECARILMGDRADAESIFEDGAA
jgi:hypothetical protein